MSRFSASIFALLLTAIPAPAQTLVSGKILSGVPTLKNAQQSYALYVPTSYSPDRKWPIVYFFDPAARGELPVGLAKDAAEKWGFILAGSNNSRNGSWKNSAEAADAMLQDTRSRFSVDDNRIYFAGFSGGARVSASLAQMCHCAAGVFLAGAGFDPSPTPLNEKQFAVFSAAGEEDFNFPEIVRMDRKLDSQKTLHLFRRFDGGHNWPPAEVFAEALAFFRILEMKNGLVPRDDAFLQQRSTFAMDQVRRWIAASLEYEAFLEAQQQARLLESFGKTADLQSILETYKDKPAVKKGPKQEAREFDDQESLERDISSALQQIGDPTSSRAAIRNDIEQQLRDLQSRSEKEKAPDRRRVLHRALSGLFIQMMESGNRALEEKSFDRAADYYYLATVAQPDAWWPVSQLAVAQASAGHTKDALATLRKAKSLAKTQADFQSWLNSEEAFHSLKSTPDFQQLLISAH